MAIIDGIRGTYSLFGFNGLVLVTKSRLLRKPLEVAVSVPGILHPVYLRLRTSDVSVFSQVFVIDQYSLEPIKYPRVIVDAGANIGLTSVFYANKYPEARILAIEPESLNYEMLKKNIAPYSKVTAIKAGLWKDNKDLHVVDPGLGKYGFQTVDHRRSDRPDSIETVSGVTIDKLMVDYEIEHIDILKIDIEGAEKEIFENASSWISRVGVIEVEMHDRLKTGCSRAVYGATKDFDYEFRKGETVYLVRKEYWAQGQLPSSELLCSSQVALNLSKCKVPFRVLASVCGDTKKGLSYF
jgi:FkbM family methyltransferase